ncbi:MAG: ubiquitin-like domain-containing protein [Anaerolineaceae bacterium]|nr:ubiquitin-like domain-containing protein [Anaerolineaceae bacterium]
MIAGRTAAHRPVWLLLLLAALVMTIMVSTVLLAIALLYRPLHNLQIDDGGQSTSFATRSATVAEALAEAGIVIHAGDDVYPPLSSELAPEMTIEIERSRKVTVQIDDMAQTYITRINEPLALIASAQLSYDPASDRIFLDGSLIDESSLQTWSGPFETLAIQRALPFTLFTGDIGVEHTSFAATVGEALQENDISIHPHDRLEPPAETPLSADLDVHIDRAKAIHIFSTDQRQIAFVIAADIASALEEAGWRLGPLDYTRPAPDTPVREGMRIDIIRVREEIVEMREEIPHQTQWLADAELELDQRRHVNGQAGERLLRYRVRFEDGVETQREQISAETLREAQDEIYYYGTRIVLRTLETELGPLEYWRVIRMELTSYHPYEYPGAQNITSTGIQITKGIVATHPDVIPYHTRVYVPGYGIGQVEDTGYGLTTTRRWLDLGYDEENYIPWRKQENVYLLTPVPAGFPYILPP